MGFFTQGLLTEQVSLPLMSDSQEIEPFSSANVGHLKIINARVTRFKETLEAIQEIDAVTLVGFALTAAGMALCYTPLISYILPSVTLAIAAISIGCSLIGFGLARRAECQYHQALADLIEVYQWSMGTRTNDYWYNIRENAIQKMILTLGPWVTINTIQTWIPDDFKEASSISTHIKEKASAVGMPCRVPTPLSQEFKAQLAVLLKGDHLSTKAYRVYGETGFGDITPLLERNFYRAKSVYAQGLSFYKQGKGVVSAFIALNPAPSQQ